MDKLWLPLQNWPLNKQTFSEVYPQEQDPRNKYVEETKSTEVSFFNSKILLAHVHQRHVAGSLETDTQIPLYKR